MSINEFEYAVVGAGAMGSATAYHLARRGLSVGLIEQFEVNHNRGASHGESRIIRLSYDHPLYVRMSARAYELWAELEADSGSKLVHKTGGLDLSEPGNPAYQACIDSMKQERVEFELLDADEIRKRHPQFNVESRIQGTYQKDAAILPPERCVRTMVDSAIKHGAVLKQNCKVQDVKVERDRTTLQAGEETIRCKKLVLTAGPWAQHMLEKIGVNVQLAVSREQFGHFRPRSEKEFSSPLFPIFAYYGTNRNGPDIEFYGFPMFESKTVKCALHHFGNFTTADSRTFDADKETLEILQKNIKELLPTLGADLVETGTCLYTNSLDRHFIIDRMPHHDGVSFGAGFSGHGFKFAILLGEILADLAIKGQTNYRIEMFSLDRFENSVKL